MNLPFAPDSRPPSPAPRRGIALAITLAALLVVTLVAGALVKSLLLSHRQSKRYTAQLQTEWLAEAGLARATSQLSASADYAGETWQAPVGSADDFGLVTIRLEAAAGEVPRTLVVEALYPRREHDRILVRRELPLPPPGGSP
jgi:Tfp pilus assembly protein PilX